MKSEKNAIQKKPVQKIRHKYKKVKNIFFDVDSTLVDFEGLDYLAQLKGLGDELSKITSQAMNGELAMNQAMNLKMEKIRPSLQEMKHLGEKYIECLVPGAVETLNQLKQRGYGIWLITGNFLPAVHILARHLNIAPENVLANEIFFDEGGKYLGYDAKHPLANNGGKAMLIREIVGELELSDETIMVGDSATDLEAKSVVDLFIGFGGVVERESVQKNADLYIVENDLRAVLDHLW